MCLVISNVTKCVACGFGVDTDNGGYDSVSNVDRQSGVIDHSNIEQPSSEALRAAQDQLPAADVDLRLLATYARLPRCLANVARPLQLARVGFFYCGRRRLRCLYCGVEIPLLEGLQESSAKERHRELSPECLLDGDVHPSSEALLRDIMSWTPLAVEVRRDGVIPQDLYINLR